MAPAIFTKEVVEQFSNLYRNPKEGWESTSYGNDWARGRGLPSSMGWYIGPEEHPFEGEHLDVVLYGDERDSSLDPKQEILSTDLGFQTDNYIFNQHGHGNATLDLPFSDNSKVDFVVVTNGSPVNLKFILQRITETNENQALSINEKVWDICISIMKVLVLIQIRN